LQMKLTNEALWCTVVVIFLFGQILVLPHIDLDLLHIEPAQKDSEFHIVYAISCDKWQLIQALTLDWSWKKVRQGGHLTRLVTGCSNKQEDLFRRSSIRDPRFHVRFSEQHNKLPNGKRYMQYNRPFALRNWLDNTEFDEPYVAILDPDFIFMRNFDKSHANITRGRPVSQKYQLSAKWLNWIPEICGPDCKKWEWKDSVHHFEAGVPYILHKLDLRPLLDVWIEFIPETWKKYNGIETDMFAYAMAAGKLNLLHELNHYWMDTCMKRMEVPPDEVTYLGSIFIHYCTRYVIGDFIWTKHWMKARGSQIFFFECESPIIHIPDFKDQVSPTEHKHLWVLNAVLPMINEAMLKYKKLHCAPGYNTDQTIVFHEATQETRNKLFHEMGKSYPK